MESTSYPDEEGEKQWGILVSYSGEEVRRSGKYKEEEGEEKWGVLRTRLGQRHYY